MFAKRAFNHLRAALGALAVLALLIAFPIHKARAQSISGVQTAVIKLTSAQILALNTTPVPAIPAPGTGFVIHIFSVTYSLTYLASGGTTYADTGSAGPYYGTSAGQAINPSITMHTALTSAQSQIVTGGISSISTVRASMDNQPVVITDTANPTTGNGTMVVV